MKTPSPLVLGSSEYIDFARLDFECQTKATGANAHKVRGLYCYLVMVASEDTGETEQDIINNVRRLRRILRYGG